MKAFIVLVNGEKQCTAGVGEFGNVHIPLTYTSFHPDDQVHSPPGQEAETLTLSVTGRVGRLGGAKVTDVSWLWFEAIQVGDEITIKVVETEEVDDPKSVNVHEVRRTYEEAKEQRRAYYEELKREFG